MEDRPTLESRSPNPHNYFALLCGNTHNSDQGDTDNNGRLRGGPSLTLYLKFACWSNKCRSSLSRIKLCDVNGDGSVTKSELKDALWSLGQNPTEEETDHIFREYDADKTGTLDFNEFKLLMTARLTYKGDQNTRAEFEDAFRAIDHNKDGNVDITELNRLMVASGFGLTNRELKEIFGFFDRDGSGKVDMAEFLDYMMDA
ncbi:unnamed protein product [Ectocarpus sp. CCAP 1310/34]|nr:unnamed protein product [Ectocarpus sp. CCAP 1310/34]